MQFPKLNSKIGLGLGFYIVLLISGIVFTNPVYKARLLSGANVKFWLGYLGPALITGLLLSLIYGGRKNENVGFIIILWACFGFSLWIFGVLESGFGLAILIILLGSVLWLGDMIGRNGEFRSAKKNFEEASEADFIEHFTRLKSFPFENDGIANIHSLQDMQRTEYFLERSNHKVRLTSFAEVTFKNKTLGLIKFESEDLFGATMYDPEKLRATLDLSGKKIDREVFRRDIRNYLLAKIAVKEGQGDAR